MKSKIIGALIVIFWLVMMYSLFHDRIDLWEGRSLSEFDPASLVHQWEDQEEWMRIIYNGANVGAFMTSIERRENENDFHLTSRLLLDIRLLFLQKKVQMTASALMNAEFILQEFKVKLDFDKTSFSGEGQVFTDELRYRIRTGQGKSTGKVILEQEPSLLDAVRSSMGRKLELKPGKTYRIPIYDPIWSGGSGLAEVTVVGREEIITGDETVEAFRVEIQLDEFTTVSWMNEEGETLRRQVMPNLFMDRADRREIIAQYPEFGHEINPPEIELITDYEIRQSRAEEKMGVLQEFLTNTLQQRGKDQ